MCFELLSTGQDDFQANTFTIDTDQMLLLFSNVLRLIGT
jgi:hypothetical protein